MKNKVKVGLFFVIFLVSLIGFLYMLNQVNRFVLKEENLYVVEFENIQGLQSGSYVKVKGNVNIGRVEKLIYNSKTSNLEVYIKFSTSDMEDVLKTNRVYFEERAVILGKSYINMRIGDLYKAPKSNLELKKIRFKGFSNTSLPNSLMNMVKRLNRILELDVRPFIKNLNTTVVSIQGFLESIDKDKVGSIITNIDFAILQIKFLLNSVKGIVSQVKLEDIRDVIYRVKSVLNEFKKSGKQVNKIMQSTEGKIYGIIYDLSHIIKKFNSTNGVLGSLIHDKKIKNDMEAILKSVKELVEKIKNHPLIQYGKKSRASKGLY